jgi:hypothetical protein
LILSTLSIEVPLPRCPHRALRATVFARHFDDAHLLDRYFEFQL